MSCIYYWHLNQFSLNFDHRYTFGLLLVFKILYRLPVVSFWITCYFWNSRTNFRIFWINVLRSWRRSFIHSKMWKKYMKIQKILPLLFYCNIILKGDIFFGKNRGTQIFLPCFTNNESLNLRVVIIIETILKFLFRI